MNHLKMNSASRLKSTLQCAARTAVFAALAIAVQFALFQPHPAIAELKQANRANATMDPPDFSGFWELAYNSRHITPAKLTAQSIARDKKAADDRAAGKVVVYASRWCNYLGMPFIMGQSPPINVVQVGDEIAIFSEQNSAPRHIYLDGRPHPSQSQFTSTTNGHSVGHWEGDELVVDTTNFSAKGHPEIPGGGYRGIRSHLVEHFKLINGGQNMQVTFTWDDPTVFLEPHSYDFVYHKLPAGTFAFEDSCDASDAAPYEHSGGVSDPPDQP